MRCMLGTNVLSVPFPTLNVRLIITSAATLGNRKFSQLTRYALKSLSIDLFRSLFFSGSFNLERPYNIRNIFTLISYLITIVFN